jgi:hypothetical protein
MKNNLQLGLSNIPIVRLSMLISRETVTNLFINNAVKNEYQSSLEKKKMWFRFYYYYHLGAINQSEAFNLHD